MQRMRKMLCMLLMTLGIAVLQAAPLKIASLHPLLSEMARSIGREQVEVVDLFPVNGDLHSFIPTGKALASAAGARLVLACGKGVEPYLSDLNDTLSTDSQIIFLVAFFNVFLPPLLISSVFAAFLCLLNDY